MFNLHLKIARYFTLFQLPFSRINIIYKILYLWFYFLRSLRNDIPRATRGIYFKIKILIVAFYVVLKKHYFVYLFTRVLRMPAMWNMLSI